MINQKRLLGGVTWVCFLFCPAFLTAQQNPRISPGGVVGGALTVPAIRAISPNALASVFGSDFTAPGVLRQVTAADLADGKLPTNLAGVCVLAGGQRGRLLFVSPYQVNFQVPLVSGVTAAIQIVVNCDLPNEVRSNAEIVPLQDATPQLFSIFLSPDGRSPLAAFQATSGDRLGATSLKDHFPGANLTFRPAAPGDLVEVFATGLGATNPPVETGALPGTSATTLRAAVVTINGVTLDAKDVLYSGVAPGFAGLYQINFRIPANTPDGDLPVVVGIGNYTSPYGDFLTVQGNQPNPISVLIGAAQNWVLSGRTLKLQAQAINATGGTVSGFIPQWFSSDPRIATVDANGMVQGLLPGAVDILVSGLGATARFTVSVFPGKVEIQPPTLDLEVGQQGMLTARALDADGKPLAGVGFTWVAAVPGTATVDSKGLVTGVSEGSLTVTALVDVPSPGYRYGADAVVTVHRHPAFRFTRVISTDLITRPVTLQDMGNISYAGNDLIAFSGTLSNGSQALLLSNQGQLQTLAVSGQVLGVTGRIIGGFQQYAVGVNGDVAAVVTSPDEFLCNHALILFRQGQAVILQQGGCSFDLSLRAMGDLGEMVYANSSSQGTALTFRRPDGSSVRIARAGDSLPGIGAVVAMSGAGIFTPGHVTFAASGATGSGFFLWDGKTIQKVVLNGDITLGGRITDLVESAANQFFIRVDNNGQKPTRIWKGPPGGPFSVVAESDQPLASSAAILGSIYPHVDARNGAVLFVADSSAGTFLLRVDQTGYQPLAQLKGSWEIEQVFLTSSGTAVTRSGIESVGVYRWTGSAPVALIQAGTSIDVAAPFSLAWDNLMKSGASTIIQRTAGSSLVQIVNGSAQPVFSAGDRLPSGLPAIWIGNSVANSKGDVFFTAGNSQASGVFILQNLAISQIAGTLQALPFGGRAIDSFNKKTAAPLAGNSLGQVLVDVGISGGDELLLLTRGSLNTSLGRLGSAAPGGGTFQAWGPAALDENGRAAFLATLSDGSTGLYLWDGASSQARKILKSGENGPRGSLLASVPNLQSAGTTLYASLTYAGGVQELSQYDGTNWRAITSSDGLPAAFGKSPNGVFRDFAANAAGDLLYISYFSDGSAGVVVRKRDGASSLVACTCEQPFPGEYIVEFYSVWVNEHGDLLFTARTSKAGSIDRIGLFQAVAN